MYNEQPEPEQSNTNAENQSSTNYSLIDYHDVPNTPFIIIQTTDGYFISIGKNRLSEVFKTKDEALNLIENKEWELLTSFMLFLVHNHKTILDNLKLKQNEHI